MNKSLLSKKARAPRKLLQVRQLIPTVIGTFLLTLDLDWAIDLRFLVQLREFRHVDVMAVFEIRLMIEIRFSYGIAYVLEFGLYVKGNVLRAEVAPIIEFNNIVPVQLVDAIANITDLKR